MSDKLEQAIVRVYGQNNYPVGTGILVSERLVLTCAHVIAQALFGTIQDMPSHRPNGIVKIDFPIAAPNVLLDSNVKCWIPLQSGGEGDIAILELPADNPIKTKPVYLVEDTNAWGHTFKAFGCPQGYSGGLWASGEIKGQQANGWVQIESSSTKVIDLGFSGGGIWNEQFNGVSGIVAQRDIKTETVAYIIPTSVLVANCEILKKCMVVHPKSLGELRLVSLNDLQTQLAFYRPRLVLAREDDLLAVASILLTLKSFDESSQILEKLLHHNPMHAYAWYLYAIAILKGRRPWLLNHNEALQIQSYTLKALQLDRTQAHFAFLLALIKEDFFQKKGFRIENPDLVSCIQIAFEGKMIKEELLILLTLVPVTTSKVMTIIHTFAKK